MPGLSPDPRAEGAGRTDEFVRMWNAGREIAEIAQHFGISRAAAISRASRLRRRGRELVRRSPRETSEGRKTRRCLGCGRPFMSGHIGNRLCWSCADDEIVGGLA